MGLECVREPRGAEWLEGAGPDPSTWSSGEAIELIERALQAYRLRVRAEGDPSGTGRTVLCCLRSALAVLQETTPSDPEEARREAIAWLVIALKSM
jgi:hypothetical protein